MVFSHALSDSLQIAKHGTAQPSGILMAGGANSRVWSCRGKRRRDQSDEGTAEQEPVHHDSPQCKRLPLEGLAISDRSETGSIKLVSSAFPTLFTRLETVHI